MSDTTVVRRGHLRAVIVGGSLAGLVSALALAREDVEVTVLERSNPAPRLGGGLGVDGSLLARVTGVTGFVGNSPLSAWRRPGPPYAKRCAKPQSRTPGSNCTTTST
ncbi:NAD(P)-binding protein [Micromonospora sp. 4G55]|uniref:FAD-dependent oxidoreductase n=1 Tax=Micromonospora sp. 4G55 TaxID=2806102 RepID=UPI001EE4EAE8|nr:NAD(P)-binding protein [Micromonospora sp. 4G55]